MTRIDWLVLKRLGSRIGLTVVIFFGIMMLVQSLDGWQFAILSRRGGPMLAVLGIVASAARWVINTLSVTVLIGTIVGVIDLQSRRELTVIKASGMSIWRVLRAPTIAMILAGLVVSVGVVTLTTRVNRDLDPSTPSQNGALTASGHLWLEQRGLAGDYILSARHTVGAGKELDEVRIFFIDANAAERVTAPKAFLVDGAWQFPLATRYRADAPPRQLHDLMLPTTTTAADLALKLKSTTDMTIFDLAAAIEKGLADPLVRSAVLTRFIGLLALPALLVGSLFIAFAFTAGYRRTNGYGSAILYGIILGFIVFVITQMADRAGSAGVLGPFFAAMGPAFVAIVIGLTVLLHKEDGRT